ncbi:PilZ domain-containing protein [Candidatus Nitrospira bockiana]
MRRRLVTCPDCGTDEVLRAECGSLVERCASAVFVSPFRCQSCSHRFFACRVGRIYPTRLVDRRQHRRIPVRLALSFSGGRIRGVGTVLDISLGGCVIASDTIVQVDDIFYLQLLLEEDRPPVEVAAMVRSISSRGIGFKFLRTARENKRLFEFLQARGA